MAKKLNKKGLWPIIAEFSYKDEQVNYSCAIRLRKFQYEVPYCELHGRIHAGLVDTFNEGVTECPYCIAHKQKQIFKLFKKKFFMYCAYVVNAEEFINAEAILSRYTALTWKKTSFRFRQKHSLVGYASSIEGIARGISYVKNIKDGKVNVILYSVSEDDLDKLYKKSENNRLLREI
jgi:hypothetical protein